MKKLSLLILLLLSGISIFIGVHELSLFGILTSDAMQWMILFKTRIPRTISLILAGGTLSVCGKILQYFMQNKFVSPSTIGMMDSARLGILIVMLWLPNASVLIRASIAFLFAYLGVLLFLFLSRILPKGDAMILPLTGVMFGNIVGAFATFFAYQYQLVQNISSWLQGNFSTVIEGNYELIYIAIPVFAILYLLSYQITVAGLGEEFAKNLGLNYQALQFIVFALVALASSAVLLMVGSIPFIGIVIPNIVSLIYRDHLKNTLFMTTLFGSGFLVICDILSRVLIAPYEIPVSLVAGIIGGVLFLFFLIRRRV